MFGVPKTLMVLPGRTTFVINKYGEIKHVFSSQMNIQKHISEAVRILKQLQSNS
jgi:peroxiredoxin Q/BCP